MPPGGVWSESNACRVFFYGFNRTLCRTNVLKKRRLVFFCGFKLTSPLRSGSWHRARLARVALQKERFTPRVMNNVETRGSNGSAVGPIRGPRLRGPAGAISPPARRHHESDLLESN